MIQDLQVSCVDAIVSKFATMYRHGANESLTATVEEIVYNPSRAMYFCDEVRLALKDTENAIHDETIIWTLMDEFKKGRDSLVF